ncbi:MAG: hypothetical protein HC812_08155 [Leptolyngbya sp. RL_3_1]|nr:hypothetical protein [Leptolyngbya sp. RL_3_1]
MNQSYRWLLIWSGLGLLLRLTQLSLKPAWMDEVATAIYSIGNSTHDLPFDQVVGLGDILRSLTFSPSPTVGDTVQYLVQEDRHPPLYFVLSHGWVMLFHSFFPSVDGLPSLAALRACSALLGALAVPLAYWVGRAAYRSALAGDLAAALTAVSPLAIALAQEARHYGLASTLVTASLGCFALAFRRVWRDQSLGAGLTIGWITINALGFATHYFTVLTYTAEAMVFGAIALIQIRQQGWRILVQPVWLQLYGVGLGTALSIGAWWPLLVGLEGSNQILNSDLSQWTSWVNPIVQTLLAWIFTLFTPITFFADTPLRLAVIVITILIILASWIRLVPLLIRGLVSLDQEADRRAGGWAIGSFLVAIMVVFAGVCYGYGTDITKGLRYTFAYYPAVTLLMAGALSGYWPQKLPRGRCSWTIPLWQKRLSGRRLVQLTGTLGLISALFVVNNLAFLKFFSPDRFIPFVQAHSTHPVVLAAPEPRYEAKRAIGIEFLSVAWEIHRHFPPSQPGSGWQHPPQFLAMGLETPTVPDWDQRIGAALAQQPAPYDLWILHGGPDLTAYGCSPALDAPQGNKGSYVYRHFTCNPAA